MEKEERLNERRLNALLLSLCTSAGCYILYLLSYKYLLHTV